MNLSATSTQYIAAYVAAVAVFFIVDLIWIGSIASGFYQQQIGHLRDD